MSLAFFTVAVHQRFWEVYRSAAQRYLVFSSYEIDEMPMYKEIENLGVFLLHCLYTDHITSRKPGCKDGTGYYLSPGSRLRIPLFRKVFVPNDPWTNGDDEEIGRVAMFIIERKPFERIGGLVHSVGTFLGYFMKADTTPESMVVRCRLLNKHLVRYGVADFVQCISQGCWSQFNEQNGGAHILEIRYNFPDSDSKITTRHRGRVFSPLLVLNRHAIVEVQDTDHASIWKVICVVILTALGFEPGQEMSYGLRLSGNESQILLEIGPNVEVPPNVLEVVSCVCRESYIELMSLDDIRYLRRSSIARQPQTAAPAIISTIITHADLKKAGQAGRLFRRVIPKSRLFNPNVEFTVEDIEELRNTTNYEIILPVMEACLLTVHKLQNGFPLKPEDNSGIHVAAASPLPNHFGSAVNIPLMYLALDDIEVPPLFLRNNQTRPADEMRAMVEEAWEILQNRWQIVTSGEDVDRNERFVDVTDTIHEFL